jgi:hypothetical protein
VTERYSIANAPQLDEATIMVSLGDGATYETFGTMLQFATGWNGNINGEDVNIVSVDAGDVGIEVRPPLDDEWETFGPTKCVRWEDINTIVIF